MQRTSAARRRSERNRDQRRLALGIRQRKNPVAQRRAQRPGRVGREGGEDLLRAGFLGDQDPGL